MDFPMFYNVKECDHGLACYSGKWMFYSHLCVMCYKCLKIC